MPRVTGQQLVEARAELERAGFEVERDARAQRAALRPGARPGSRTRARRPRWARWSRSRCRTAPGDVLVPAVANLREAQAITELEDAGLKVTLDREFSDEVREGFAIRTVPARGRGGAHRPARAAARERGPGADDRAGRGRPLAGVGRVRAARRGAGVGVQEQESDEPEGDVIAQDPSGGAQVDRGTTVTITVSIGRPQSDVPNVVGLSQRDARQPAGQRGPRAGPARAPTVTDPSRGRRGDRPAARRRHRGRRRARGRDHHRRPRGDRHARGRGARGSREGTP